MAYDHMDGARGCQARAGAMPAGAMSAGAMPAGAMPASFCRHVDCRTSTGKSIANCWPHGRPRAAGRASEALCIRRPTCLHTDAGMAPDTRLMGGELFSASPCRLAGCRACVLLQACRLSNVYRQVDSKLLAPWETPGGWPRRRGPVHSKPDMPAHRCRHGTRHPAHGGERFSASPCRLARAPVQIALGGSRNQAGWAGVVSRWRESQIGRLLRNANEQGVSAVPIAGCP